MFSIEHEFDATVVTLVDQGQQNLVDDVTISAFDDCVTVTQHNTTTDRIHSVTLSLTQVRDLAAALDLPEGVYQLKSKAKK